MVSCVIRRCGNTSAKISKNKDGVTFHRFPRDPERRVVWERAVDRDAWRATPASCVCSRHFLNQDFYVTESGLRKLALSAVPSINISVCQEAEASLQSGGAAAGAPVGPDDSPEVARLKMKVRRLEELAEQRRRRANRMWQTQRRLRARLRRVAALVRQLVRPGGGGGGADGRAGAGRS